MATTEPILSSPEEASMLNIGGSRLARRITSEATGGALSVVEFISPPGEGVGLHVHEREDELVYLIEGDIDVFLGAQTIRVPAGACALLPRGIPHGYRNVGVIESRLLAVLLPGGLDRFFVELDAELRADRPHEPRIERLCGRFGLTFLASNAS